MFDNLLASTSGESSRSAGGFVFSLLLHGVILAAVIAVPLVYYQGLPEGELVSFLIRPPAPPPPPPPPRERPSATRPNEQPVVVTQDWVAPPVIPDNIPPPSQELPLDHRALTGDGKGSGVPRGASVGNIGIPQGLQVEPAETAPPPPPPPAPKPKKPLLRGGSVLASKLVKRVQPRYPELARKVRAEGLVLIRLLIDEEGNVAEAKVVRQGHPLLYKAALEAVRQWKYSPTLLNGEPVPVTGTVTVRFKLDR